MKDLQEKARKAEKRRKDKRKRLKAARKTADEAKKRATILRDLILRRIRLEGRFVYPNGKREFNAGHCRIHNQAVEKFIRGEPISDFEKSWEGGLTLQLPWVLDSRFKTPPDGWDEYVANGDEKLLKQIKRVREELEWVEKLAKGQA